ncbi:MAG: iron-containing alcohol dehydrogenase [Phycisphaerales bacterium]|nr:iron-containing alcohol dehydrogenase [Phycisphaerales bacterium]
MISRPPDLESATTTRIVFGPGSLAHIGSLVCEHGGSRVLLVTDQGLVRAGHAARAQEILDAAGLEVAVFDHVRPNPTDRDVEACLAVARQRGINFFVALGGGSAIDAAKGCNFLLTNGGSMRDYKGRGKVSTPLLPLIAIPTTAGTGSEVQSFALIADEHTHMKMACGDDSAAPRVAILDPELATTQPQSVIAASGVDAIAHAVESCVATNATDESRSFAAASFARSARHFERVLIDARDVEAQGQMLLAASMAGISIEKSMLGIAHSMANPLTAHFGVVHGVAVGLMLPHVVEFNAAESSAAGHYRLLATAGGFADGASGLAAALRRWQNAGRMPDSLESLGVPRESLPTLAGEAAAQWTARFNPRTATAADLLRLYEQAYR